MKCKWSTPIVIVCFLSLLNQFLCDFVLKRSVYWYHPCRFSALFLYILYIGLYLYLYLYQYLYLYLYIYLPINLCMSSSLFINISVQCMYIHPWYFLSMSIFGTFHRTWLSSITFSSRLCVFSQSKLFCAFKMFEAYTRSVAL